MFGETVKKRAYTGLIMYGWTSAVTETPKRTLHSSQIPTAANNWAGANYIAFDNKRMDTLIDQAETELDPAKGKLLWAEMQKIYAGRTAGAAAVLPRRAARHPEVAGRLHPDRTRRLFLPVVGELAYPVNR